MSVDQVESNAALPGRAVLSAYRLIGGTIAALIVLQAFLAGEWLAGQNLIRVHAALGLGLVVLSLAHLALACAARGAEPQRKTLVAVSLLLVALMGVQVVLGLAGFDHATQARAFHLPNGLLLFGIAVYSATRMAAPPRPRQRGGVQ
jgi:hypothetical protein